MFQFRKLFRDQSATTAVEYAIMMALILIACIIGISSFGSGGSNLWVNILDQLNTFMGN